jgi:proteasome lid subunit RPN8/RPN11
VPSLRFSPTAWAKLLFLRDAGETEVGGFGISAADDLLHVEDVQLVRQVSDMASVAFDDEAVADFFDRQIDAGRRPEQFARLWVHTHPGSSPQPSQTDDETFARVFGRTTWAVMFILARGGQAFARLRFHVGPGGDVDLPVCVDYSRPFSASDHAAWKAEYVAAVETTKPLLLAPNDAGALSDAAAALDPWDEDIFSAWDGLFEFEPAGFLEPKEARHVV